jgi:hypothetical protein
LILILGLITCRLNGDYTSEKMISPTKKFYLIATVNRTDHNKKDFASVVIHLYNFDKRLLSEVDTKVGDASKWSVGWDKLRDTIILYSSDIDNRAFKIVSEEIKPIELTDEINRRANELKQEKYRE